jgi:ABC-type branched-subunit amino acid transport system substrate-binding protein
VRGRMLSVLAVAALVGAGCGGGTRGDEATGLGGEEPAGAPGGARGGGDPACEGAEPEATEIGVTAEEITVTVMADTGSQAIPGMANGSVEAVEAWADLVNEQGGLACRQVEVRTHDSKINPDESRNGYVDGCQSSLAMVGTFALAVVDASPLAQCDDQAGEPTGLPEVTAVTQNVLHFCNPTTYAVGGQGQPCPPVEGRREFQVAAELGKYMSSALGDDAHGVYLVANTSPSTVASVMPQIRSLQDAGLAADAEAGAAGNDPQSHYTPYATTLADEGSNFVYNTATFPSFLQFRNEAAAQGDDSVEMWMCISTCYDPAFIDAGRDLAVGTQVVLSHLPFEEAGANEEMQTFVDRVDTHNTFSMQSWLAARLFETAVRQVAETEGPNGLTRASLLEALDGVRGFDAGGLIGPVTPSERLPPACIVIVEATEDGFERVFPEEGGELSCGEHRPIELDPTTAFSG